MCRVLLLIVFLLALDSCKPESSLTKQEQEPESIFSALETNLNALAERAGGLKLTVPMAFIEGQKL